MVPMPSQLPAWATSDQIDPVSNQNNVLVPPPEMQLYGWQRLQFPPRNWFNWLARYTYLWIQWLSQQQNLTVVSDGTSAYTLFNTATGKIAQAQLSVVDSAGNYVTAIAYLPTPVSMAVTMVTIATNSVITLSTIATTGKLTVSGGSAPYRCVGITSVIGS